MVPVDIHRPATTDPARSPALSSSHGLYHAVRLDDVRIGFGQAALAISAALKAVDQFATGHPAAGSALAAAVIVMLWRIRLGAALTALAVVPILAGDHSVLLFLVAVIVALFPDWKQRTVLYRTQLTALYLYAGVAKLTSDTWTPEAMEPLRQLFLGFGWLPAETLIWGVVATEIGLAVMLWIAPRVALASGLLLHAAIVVGMWTAVYPNARITLVLFNVLAAGLLIEAVRPGSPPSPQPKSHPNGHPN